MAGAEGYVPVDGHRVWYRRIGEGPGTPLLTLHGGPGASHDYLEPLAALGDDRPVVFFDQLGGGRSDRPGDPSLWRIDRFCDEVDQVRDALGLHRVHLFGQSWGGWLAVEYMLTRPLGIAGLVLASTSASIPQFVAEAERLKAALPPETYAIMRRHEADGSLDHPDYLAAVDLFYRRHLCRLDPWPDSLRRGGEELAVSQVYAVMNGPNEFTVTGNLKDWDRIDRLGEIDAPTLITVGRYDEVTPACARTLHDGIAGSRLVVFENSAHSAHLEEQEEYLRVLRGFLADLDRRPA